MKSNWMLFHAGFFFTYLMKRNLKYRHGWSGNCNQSKEGSVPNYRVYQSELVETKCLWGIVGSIFFFKLGCREASWGVDIWISSICFKKSKTGWPQQSPTERIYQWKMEFCWSIPQKGASIGHLGARDDPTIRISKIFDEMRLLRSLRPLRLLRLLRSMRLKMF